MATPGTSTWRQESFGQPCAGATLALMDFQPGIRLYTVKAGHEAWKGLALVMAAHGYACRAADTGSYNCRTITNGTSPSPHSWGIAADFNWQSNPYSSANRLITDMPRAMVGDILAIRTAEGAPVFLWGGNFRTVKDPMHFELIVTPGQLSKGIDWSTVRADEVDKSDPRFWPVLDHGDRGPWVRRLQRMLNDCGMRPEVEDDGVLGRATLRTVRRFQASRGLESDGVVGVQTWIALRERLPERQADEPRPDKRRKPAFVPPEPDWGAVGGALRRGSTGQEVRNLQFLLCLWKRDILTVDGTYGPATEAAVRYFQDQARDPDSAAPIAVDGRAGPATWAALRAAIDGRD